MADIVAAIKQRIEQLWSEVKAVGGEDVSQVEQQVEQQLPGVEAYVKALVAKEFEQLVAVIEGNKAP